MPELIPLQKALREFGLSQATLFRWLQAGRLKRYVRPGTGNITWVDRRALRELTKPKVV